jgi:hypothetical protein
VTAAEEAEEEDFHAQRKRCLSVRSLKRAIPRPDKSGLGVAHLPRDPQRRDRLWLLNGFAIALLTLLGAAREALRPAIPIKFNTAKRCTHLLLRQGAVAYPVIPKMPETARTTSTKSCAAPSPLNFRCSSRPGSTW